MYKITVSKLNSDPTTFRTNWTIKITCESTEEGIDNNVFVFHARPDGDTYSNVASLYDMNSLPVGGPTNIINDDGTEQQIPYYRMPEVTLDFCNTTDSLRFIDIVTFDLRLLVKEYKAANELKDEQTIIIS